MQKCATKVGSYYPSYLKANFNNSKISGVDSCGGDSGGPLVYRAIADDPYYQVGIVSYGTKICGQGVPGVYTRVTSFLDWIQSKLRE